MFKQRFTRIEFGVDTEISLLINFITQHIIKLNKFIW